MRTTVPQKAFDAGRYPSQVNVIDPQSQKVAFRRAPVAVLPKAPDRPSLRFVE